MITAITTIATVTTIILSQGAELGGKASLGLMKVLALVDSRGLPLTPFSALVSGGFSATVMRTKAANTAHTRFALIKSKLRQSLVSGSLGLISSPLGSAGKLPPSRGMTAQKIAAVYD